MYKSLIRLKPPVKRVWVEQVQDISEEDALAEGIGSDTLAACGDHPELRCYVTIPDDNHAYVTPIAAFQPFWNTLYPGSWGRNDWVFACEFSINA
jgi:hypothetical protein